jgi:hypothetical protein
MIGQGFWVYRKGRRPVRFGHPNAKQAGIAAALLAARHPGVEYVICASDSEPGYEARMAALSAARRQEVAREAALVRWRLRFEPYFKAKAYCDAYRPSATVRWFAPPTREKPG